MAGDDDWVEEVLEATVRIFVKLLVAGDYEIVARLDQSRRFSERQWRELVEHFPGRLIPPPRNLSQRLQISEVPNRRYRTFKISLPLWSLPEEGPHLVLTALAIEDIPRTVALEVLDLSWAGSSNNQD